MRTPTKASIYIQDPASPNCWQHPGQDASSKQQARQKHKLDHQQTPQNILPHTTLPSRGGKLIFFHQNASTSPSKHKTYTNYWTKLTHQSRKPKGRIQQVSSRPRSASLSPARPHSAPLGHSRSRSAPLGPARPPSAPLGRFRLRPSHAQAPEGALRPAHRCGLFLIPMVEESRISPSTQAILQLIPEAETW